MTAFMRYVTPLAIVAVLALSGCADTPPETFRAQGEVLALYSGPEAFQPSTKRCRINGETGVWEEGSQVTVTDPDGTVLGTAKLMMPEYQELSVNQASCSWKWGVDLPRTDDPYTVKFEAGRITSRTYDEWQEQPLIVSPK